MSDAGIVPWTGANVSREPRDAGIATGSTCGRMAGSKPPSRRRPVVGAVEGGVRRAACERNG